MTRPQLIRAAPAPSRTSGRSIGSNEAIWLDVCERELDHLRAVLGWMIDHSHTQAAHGLWLATALTPFWRQRGSISEGRRWLEATLHVASCTTEEAPPPLRAQALNALGVLLMWQGAYAQAQRCHDDALAIFSESGDQPGVARSLFRLGFLANGRGDYVAATKHLEQSLRICQDLADDLGVDMACNRLGITAWNQGEYERAVEALERSLAFQRDREAPGACAATLLNLGALMLERGDPSRAMILLQESLALNQTLHDTFALAYVQTYIGYAALCRHELRATKRAFCEALAVLDPKSAPEITCRLLDGIARVSAQQGRTVNAARIWGGMDTFRTRHRCAFRPVEQNRHEEETAAALQSIGTWAFAAAWREGCALSLTDLLIEAKSSLGWRENDSADSETPAAKEDAVEWRFQTTRHPSQSTLILKAPQQATLRLYALGQVQAYRGQRAVTTTDLTYSKARELLFFS